jgi:hypothetical protein
MMIRLALLLALLLALALTGRAWLTGARRRAPPPTVGASTPADPPAPARVR